jgi:hypothetical protein
MEAFHKTLHFVRYCITQLGYQHFPSLNNRKEYRMRPSIDGTEFGV